MVGSWIPYLSKMKNKGTQFGNGKGESRKNKYD